MAIEYCEQLSMRLLPVSLLPRLIIEGQFENRNIRFCWKGGLMLECTTIEYKQQTHHLKALKYQEDIEAALDRLTIIDARLEPTSKLQNQ